MKIIFIIILLCFSKDFFAQDSAADLNGKIFSGTATEIQTQGNDNTPVQYNEIIRFDSGKIYSNILKKYLANDCYYTSEVDGRRMIALKVVKFDSKTTGISNGKSVTLEFSGEIIGESNLSGIFTVRYSDGKEILFTLVAKAM